MSNFMSQKRKLENTISKCSFWIRSSENVSPQNDSSIFLYTDKQYVQVDIADILYVEASGNYVKVFLLKEQLIIRERLADLLLKLGHANFLQVHKSFVVAKSHIDKVEGNRIKIRAQSIPVGNFFKAKLMALLNK